MFGEKNNDYFDKKTKSNNINYYFDHPNQGQDRDEYNHQNRHQYNPNYTNPNEENNNYPDTNEYYDNYQNQDEYYDDYQNQEEYYNDYYEDNQEEYYEDNYQDTNPDNYDYNRNYNEGNDYTNLEQNSNKPSFQERFERGYKEENQLRNNIQEERRQRPRPEADYNQRYNNRESYDPRYRNSQYQDEYAYEERRRKKVKKQKRNLRYDIPKNKLLTYAAYGFLGLGGIHDFYLNHYIAGTIKFCTCNFFFIGTIIDCIRIMAGRYKEFRG